MGRRLFASCSPLLFPSHSIGRCEVDRWPHVRIHPFENVECRWRKSTILYRSSSPEKYQLTTQCPVFQCCLANSGVGVFVVVFVAVFFRGSRHAKFCIFLEGFLSASWF